MKLNHILNLKLFLMHFTISHYFNNLFNIQANFVTLLSPSFQVTYEYVEQPISCTECSSACH